MLAAYYGRGGDRRGLFENRKLSQHPGWDVYLGKLDVIQIVISDLDDRNASIGDLIGRLTRRVLAELREAHPAIQFDEDDLPFSLRKLLNETGRQIVFLIDEWDVVFRSHPHDLDGQRDYLDFLRNLFKDQSYVALAYMTGILPVKKYGQHSALNMFDEYSMVAPLQFAPYTGFTPDEVQILCGEYGRSFQKCQEWYNGYRLTGPMPPDPQHLGLQPRRYDLYAPLSVINAVQTGFFKPYWNNTETYEALAEYIRMNFDGLRETVVRLMNGAHLPVNISSYQNDMTSLACRDDVLTLLIHLGYLGYDQEKQEVFIPNHEIHEVFETSTRSQDWSSSFRALQNSRKLLEATLAGDAETIAELIEAAHDTSGKRTYNSEAALNYAIQLAYYAAQDEYTLIPDLDTGKGYADLAYLPKHAGKPAILVELKYEKDANTAIRQIQRQRYPERLAHYRGNLILVGINYERDASPDKPNFKHHTCTVSRG